ncbi:4-oxalocrotonate tautomerase DmpI [Anaerospora hongkongensis]|uniref:4-oxalocrotonate tautomerase DmpI n=1 Tax=Anaerospora hongkongensis TaxID=244830 RepID=UPI002FDB30B3
MPIITIEGPCLSTDQKRQLVRDITKAARAVIPLPAEAFTVLIKENSHDNVGVGGELLADKIPN